MKAITGFWGGFLFYYGYSGLLLRLLCFTEYGHFYYLPGKLMYVTHHQ